MNAHLRAALVTQLLPLGPLILKSMSELVLMPLDLGPVQCFRPKEEFCCLEFCADATCQLGASRMHFLSWFNCRFIKSAGGRYFMGLGAIRLIMRVPDLQVTPKEAILSIGV